MLSMQVYHYRVKGRVKVLGNLHVKYATLSLQGEGIG